MSSLVGKIWILAVLDLLSGQGSLENTSLFYGAYLQQNEERRNFILLRLSL